MKLRYVILYHTGYDEDHFDVMVEREPGGVLRTWRSATWPIDGAVTAIHDHRRKYLNYEGPISGGRGEVRRVASGTCTSPADIGVVEGD